MALMLGTTRPKAARRAHACFFFQAEDGIRDTSVTGVQTCALPIFLELLKVEARRRYDARMTPGKAAADIRMGQYENWIGPERIIMDTVRFYAEFAGTLKIGRASCRERG